LPSARHGGHRAPDDPVDREQGLERHSRVERGAQAPRVVVERAAVARLAALDRQAEGAPHVRQRVPAVGTGDLLERARPVGAQRELEREQRQAVSIVRRANLLRGAAAREQAVDQRSPAA
jgi:hypothetical protein